MSSSSAARQRLHEEMAMGAVSMHVPETELPDHLRYHEPQVAEVRATPRYLNERQKRSPITVDQQPTINKDPKWESTTPRYLNPKSGPPPPPPMPCRPASQVEAHKQLAMKLGFNPHPRYLDPPKHQREGELSPKEIIEAEKHQQHRELQWRGTSFSTKLTFDDLRRRNRNLLMRYGKADHNDTKAKAGKTSVIHDYVYNHGTIQHHTTTINVTPKRQSSPSRISNRPWSGGGGAGGGQWGSRTNSPSRFQAVEAYVRQRTSESSVRRVSRDHVPRVASLSPANMSLRMSYSETPPRARAGSSSPMSRGRSPNRSQGPGTPTSPPLEHHGQADLGSPEVLVGPMTVSIPEGTVLRLAEPIGAASSSASVPAAAPATGRQSPTGSERSGRSTPIRFH